MASAPRTTVPEPLTGRVQGIDRLDGRRMQRCIAEHDGISYAVE